MRFKRPTTIIALAVMALLVVSVTPLKVARADDDNRGLEAVPFTFVGTASDCTPSPAGSRIVTSAWLNGFGLPDNGGNNAPDPLTRNDPHSGLLLSKNGPTTDCSAAGARITGVQGMMVTATFHLGYDVRNGTHCSGGAPRFNVVTSDNVFHFVGACTNGTQTPAPQDPIEWTRARFTAAAGEFPPLVPGTTIKSISIIYDEGTDTPGPATQDPNGVGLANIDNIDINGKLITSGPSHGDRDDNDNDHGHGHDDEGNSHGHGHGG